MNEPVAIISASLITAAGTWLGVWLAARLQSKEKAATVTLPVVIIVHVHQNRPRAPRR